MTKVPYPQVIRRLLEALDLPINLQGCQKAAELLKSHTAVEIRLSESEAIRQFGSDIYTGCYNDRRINAEIAVDVLTRLPSLVPLVEDFRNEDSDYSSLCAWLNRFIEDVAWLAGNRKWPVDFCITVKRSVAGKFQGGVLRFEGSTYIVRGRDSSTMIGRETDEVLGRYRGAFAVALDGWSVD